MRRRLGRWLVATGWALRYRHLAPDAAAPYPPPTPWQFRISMALVRTGDSLARKRLLRDWLAWWKAWAYRQLVSCIPLTLKERLRRRIRGW